MRRKSKGELAEYDSLTDTVTNVVGVLVIVLAVTRVSLGSRRGGNAGAPPGASSPAAVAALEDETKAKARLAQLDAEILEARLTPPPGSPWTVPIPDPARVENKELVAFYCQGGRIHPFRYEQLTELLNERARGILGVEYLSELEKHERVADYCKDHVVGDGFLRWNVVVTKVEGEQFSARAQLTRKKPNAGETAEGIASSGSAFQRLLGKLNYRKKWIYFFVWEDSFDVYLLADRIAKSNGFATGWVPYAADETYGIVLTRSRDAGADEARLRPFPQ